MRVRAEGPIALGNNRTSERRESIEETGWLIEAPPAESRPPMWWAAGGWTPDSLLAVRFSRRVDAERVISYLRSSSSSLVALRDPLVDSAIATEHGWG